MVEDENVDNGLGGEGDDKGGVRVLLEPSLLVSVYHMTRLSLTFNTDLGMTLQSQYCTQVYH